MALKIHGTDNIQAGTVQTEVLAGGVGGGPKITSIAVTDSSYTNIDDTAVNLSGGYIKITGTGFSSGCQVVVGATVATAVVFVSSTEVRAQIPAQSAGTYTLYVTNTDGGVAIRVNAVNYSATPSWTTTSPLPNNQKNTSVSIQLTATSNSSVTYALQAGSSLPSGLTLSSSGLITGTTPDIANETTYNFTVVATDQENQDTPQAFQVTITVNDPYFEYVTLLLNNQTNNILTDSSTNNFSLTAVGDARASNFSPYGTGWSVYFDGTGDYLGFGNNNPLPATDDFTFECWIYVPSLPGVQAAIIANQNQSNRYMLWLTSTGGLTIQVGGSFSRSTGNNVITTNKWYHIATTRIGTTHNLFVDGTAATLTTSGSSPASIDNTEFFIGINYNSSYAFTGYISNFRIVTSILYTSTFTPSTSPLTAISGTNLLTCHTNRFLDGSTNSFAITRNGDAKVTGFNPFGITNTGTTGSAYFDGTGDYLSVPANSAWNLSSGSFCIECWSYPTTAQSDRHLFSLNNSSGTGYWVLRYNTGTVPQFIYNNYVTSLTSSTAATINAWNHIAMVSNGTTMSLYLNGTRVATGSATSINDGSANPLLIGSQLNVSSREISGYFTDGRVVKGSSVYDPTQTTIAIPTAPLTAIANTQLLTCQYKQPHNNHSFLDASSNNHLITRSGNVTQGTFSPFSQTGWGNYFDGTGDYLLTTSTQIIPIGSFTVEAWVYPTASTDSYAVAQGTTGNAGRFSLGITSNLWYVQIGSAAVNAGSVTLNQWTYLAATFNGTTLTLYVNGSSVGTAPTTTNAQNTTLRIGSLGPADWGTAYWTGYISNVRTSNTVRTVTTVPTSPYTNDGNTTFLSCQSNRFRDVSNNSFTITPSGDTRVVAFSPFNPTASWSAATHGGSGYFDGTGDYLQLPITALTGQFTIEFWFYRAVTGNNFTFTIGDSLNATGSEIYIGTNGTILNYYTGQAARITATPPDVGSWSYIAATRDSSNVVRLYVNGTQVGGTYTHAATLDTTLRVGAEYYSGAVSGSTNGYISNFRISNIVRTITLSTQPLVADANTLCLLNFTNAGVYDATSKNVLETVGDAKISTAQSKFGGSSMLFDGTGDQLTAADNVVIELGNSNFTIEGFIYFTVGSKRNAIVTKLSSTATASTSSFGLEINDTNKLSIGLSDNSTYTTIVGSTTLSTNTWYYVAAVRSENTVKLYVNGVEDATGSFSATIPDKSVPLGIGGGGGYDGLYFTGYLQDIRITRGYARYTANFTPPTQAFPTL